MASKYDPLGRYLAAQSNDRVMLTLAEIEAIIGSALPAGARKRNWWTGSSVRASLRRALGAGGWQIVVDAFWGREPVVTFLRDRAAHTPTGPA